MRSSAVVFPLHERRPIPAGLVEGCILAVLMAAGMGLFRHCPFAWLPLALCLRGFGKSVLFQAAMMLPMVILTGVMAAVPLRNVLMPVVAGLAVTHLPLPKLAGEFAGYAVSVLVGYFIVDAWFAGPIAALGGLLWTAMALLVVRGIGLIIDLVRGIRAERDELGGKYPVSGAASRA